MRVNVSSPFLETYYYKALTDILPIASVAMVASSMGMPEDTGMLLVDLT
jgi:hypothetical protein